MGIAPALELLVASEMAESVAAKNAVSVEEETGAAVVDASGSTVAVDNTVVVELCEEVLEAEDDEDDEDFLEEDEVVDAVVLAMTSLPAVIVTSCPPRADPPSVNVMVDETALLVTVPRLASTVLLHAPEDPEREHPTMTDAAGSAVAVGVWEYS